MDEKERMDEVDIIDVLNTFCHDVKKEHEKLDSAMIKYLEALKRYNSTIEDLTYKTLKWIEEHTN